MMEHISEILRRQTQMNASKADTDASSKSEAEENPPESVCPVCKGARFVHPLLPSGKPDFSQVVPCHCTEQDTDEKRHSRLQRYSNLGSLTRLTFASLNPKGKNEELINQEQFRRAYEAVRAFAKKPEGWLILSGPSGCGKTHLAAGIANHCIENSRPVFYITTPDLLDHLRSSFNPDSEMPYDEFFEQVRNTPLLIMDDFGVQSSTPWAKEKLDQLLTHRFNNQLPTVIVSIVPVEELEDRIRTRLVDSELCQIHEISNRQSTLPTLHWGGEFKLQKEMTFENFDWKRVNLEEAQRRNLEDAYNLALQFAKSPEGWLVLMGDNGCGKTHLAAAIVNYQYKNNNPALFIVVPDFLDHLRSTFSPESKTSYDQYFESVKGTPLLILDDFGAQTTSPWAQEKLYQLLNHRFNNQLPTVIVSIVPVEELEDRIRTRLVDSELCQIHEISTKQAGLPTSSWAGEFKLQKEMTFDNFDWKRVNLPLEQRQNLEDAYNLVLQFAKSPEGWLVLQGANGCGKTHLAAAIVNYQYNNKKPALFIVVPDFLDHLRSTFSPESKISYDQYFESVKSTPLLILDDFGAQTTSPWAQEKLYQVINHRYNARLPTVITTNCSLEEIENRISSRLADTKISVSFNIIAPHYRADRSGTRRAIRGSRKRQED